MIEEYKIGRFVVDGKEFLGDLMIINNKPHYWQTRQRRKLRIEDIKELVEEKPEVFIIGTGAGGMLEIEEKVTEYINENINNVFLIVSKNSDAIDSYNEAEKKGKKICGVFPSSC